MLRPALRGLLPEVRLVALSRYPIARSAVLVPDVSESRQLRDNLEYRIALQDHFREIGLENASLGTSWHRSYVAPRRLASRWCVWRHRRSRSDVDSGALKPTGGETMSCRQRAHWLRCRTSRRYSCSMQRVRPLCDRGAEHRVRHRDAGHEGH